jgi:hypothetical protein
MDNLIAITTHMVQLKNPNPQVPSFYRLVSQFALYNFALELSIYNLP